MVRFIHQTKNGIFHKLALVSGLMMAALVPVIAASTPAAALSGCGSGGYSWGGYYTTNHANQGILGDINYASGDFTLNSGVHALNYVDASSQADASAAYGNDWLQAGYALGQIDTADATTPQVYVESNDQNGGPNARIFANSEYPLGNHWFETEYSGEYSSGRGYYLATYSLNYNLLWTAWEVDPTYTQQYAQVEGSANSGDYCPTISNSLFGTNGNELSPNWNSNTQLEIATNGSPVDVIWTPNAIATTSHGVAPYSVNTYSSDSAFNGHGG